MSPRRKRKQHPSGVPDTQQGLSEGRAQRVRSVLQPFLRRETGDERESAPDNLDLVTLLRWVPATPQGIEDDEGDRNRHPH